MKKCSKCEQEKPLDQFRKQKWCKFGVRPECKTCSYAAARARVDPEKKREYSRRYRAKNPNKDREYYEKNKAVLLKKQYAYAKRNWDVYLARLRKWRKENPEKVQVWVRNRRAKLKGLSGSHTLEDIKALMQSQRGKCVYCATDIHKAYHVDHIVPVSADGSNDKSNIQLLCKTCNLSKNAKDPVEFAQSLGKLL